MEFINFNLSKSAREKLAKFILIYLAIQPFLSYYIFFSDSMRETFLLSPSTIIRVLGFTAIFLYFIISCKNKRRLYKFLSLFIIPFTIYSIVHIYGALNIDFLPTVFEFSIVDELFYLFRMSIPLLLFVVIYNVKPKYNEVLTTLFYVALTTSMTIIVTNILGVSLVSYSEKIEMISHNFFSWFSPKNIIDNFVNMTSKGLFLYGNEIGNVLLLLLPINIILFYREPKLKYGIGLFATLISMLMIGTRVGLWGSYIMLMLSLISYVLIKFINKEKQSNDFLFFFLIISIIFVFISMLSPAATRYNFLFNIHSSFSFDCFYILLLVLIVINYIKSYKDNKLLKKNAFILFLSLFLLVTLNNFTIKKFGYTNTTPEKTPTADSEVIIDSEQVIKNIESTNIYREYYTKIYPKSFDNEFWTDLIKKPETEYNNTRKVQQHIFDRMIYNSTKKSGTFYKLFGLSYSNYRNSNGYKIYLEKDFKIHYFTLGIVGLLLYLCPYLLFLLYACFIIINHLKKGIVLEKIMISSVVFVIILTSYFGGHVFDEMLPTIILSVVISLFFINEKGGKKNEV